MSVKVLIRYKELNDYDWRGPEILNLTRIPAIGEYIAAGPFDFKLCLVTMIIHTPSSPQSDVEVYCDYVEREQAANKVEKFELRQPGSNINAEN